MSPAHVAFTAWAADLKRTLSKALENSHRRQLGGISFTSKVDMFYVLFLCVSELSKDSGPSLGL